MIIRAVAVLSLLSMLCLVLYLPTSHPPERFIAQIRAEHALNTAYWGEQHATEMFRRMAELHVKNQITAQAPARSRQPTPGIDTAVAKELSGLGARILDNDYFRSLDMLVALATYRYTELVYWLPISAVFILAALVDGYVRRIVKSKEFLQHSPELFALYICVLIIAACGTVVSFVIPVTVTPLLFAVAPLAMGCCASLSIANFHYRG